MTNFQFSESELRRFLDDAASAEAARDRAALREISDRTQQPSSLAATLAGLSQEREFCFILMADGNGVHGTVVSANEVAVVIVDRLTRHLLRTCAIRAVKARSVTPIVPGLTRRNWSDYFAALSESEGTTVIHIGDNKFVGELRVTSDEAAYLQMESGDVVHFLIESIDHVSRVVEPSSGSIRQDSINATTSSRLRRMTRPNR